MLLVCTSDGICSKEDNPRIEAIGVDGSNGLTTNVSTFTTQCSKGTVVGNIFFGRLSSLFLKVDNSSLIFITQVLLFGWKRCAFSVIDLY